jgi:hypothetical protein
MKKFGTISAILIFCIATACGGSSAGSSDPKNLLIGKWKFMPTATSSNDCLKTMEFTATTYTAPDMQGKLTTMPVTYITNGAKTVTFPSVIYMMTDASAGSLHVTFKFTSSDAMMPDIASSCPYARQ